jgi:hypothetical protein
MHSLLVAGLSGIPKCVNLGTHLGPRGGKDRWLLTVRSHSAALLGLEQWMPEDR